MGLKDAILALTLLLASIGYSNGDCNATEQEACKLPTCLCPSLEVPAGLTPETIPQIVYLTFDDGVNIENYAMYEKLFFNPEKPRLNPNGQPVTTTYYVTHEYTDYNLVHQLWRQGHEIALHTITHQTDPQYWKNLDSEGWRAEAVDQKPMLAHFAKIPEDDIKGFRAPFLQTGGDIMVKEISQVLEFDSSRPTRTFMDPPLWPYTAEFDTGYQDCPIEPCSVESYPGFWNVPMVDMEGGNGNPCAMVDMCLPQPNTTEQTVDLLTKNFLRHYEGNRAPFGVFTHSAWLSELFPGHLSGYEAFLDYLGTLPDVYIVSVSRALEWMKNPTSLDTINDFEHWKVEVKADQCATKFTCQFAIEDTPGFPSERYMTSCQSCPKKYPWKNNPFGDDIRIRANKFDRS